MSLAGAQDKFLKLMRGFKNEDERIHFLRWIKSNWLIDNLPVVNQQAVDILNSIADDLRKKMPQDAVFPTEKIFRPVSGVHADYDPEITIHIDEFLYNDDIVDDLVQKGEMSRHYCASCNSRNIKPLNFITHSMSINQISALFTALLPPLKGKVFLDVGSRLGGVLYGAYLFSSCSRIIGVEMNSELCRLQKDIVHKYCFNDRIEIMCTDVFDIPDLLSTCDVIILNDVFSFFCDEERIKRSWRRFAEHVKVGSIIVTIPHLEITFGNTEIGFDWREWVEELPLQNPEILDEYENQLEHVKHYEVKKKIRIR